MNIDPAKVRHAARSGTPLVIQSGLLPPQTEADLDEILGIYLEELGREDLRDRLGYCLRELTGNARKANIKRAYFREKKLDINDPGDYAKGMEAFKRDTIEAMDRWGQAQEKQGFHIRVSFLLRDRTFLLRVANNAPLTRAEADRIADRIDRARALSGMERAFEAVLDDSEGAGLGLTILILLLRKIGLPDRAFSLEASGAETVATLRLPADEVRHELVAQLADELVAVVEALPPFPENLRHLLRLLDQPDVGFPDLAARLSMDPALTSDLIRYINSAGKGRKSRVTNLQDAVKLVGLAGIREMIVPYGTQKILDRFLSKQKVLWTEAQRISFLAAGIARDRGFGRQERDLAQIGGLLSTLGQIVVTYLHPEWTAPIEGFCRQKNLSLEHFNDLTQILNPAELGARVAEKWQFPSNLVDVLRHQAYPRDTAPDLYPVAAAIAAARAQNALEQHPGSADPVDPHLLKDLGLDGPGRFEDLVRRIGSETA